MRPSSALRKGCTASARVRASRTGALAATATTTVDLWLFWTTATALLTFTQPMATAYEPIPKAMHKYFYLVNLLAGAFVIYKALNGHAS